MPGNKKPRKKRAPGAAARSSSSRPENKNDRLANALRDNLRKRKAQEQTRQGGGAGAKGFTGRPRGG